MKISDLLIENKLYVKYLLNKSDRINHVKKSINEGGWASTETQGTKITPEVVKDMVARYKDFINKFNEYLTSKNVPNVNAGRPAGSAAYYEKDLIDDPEKEYGDVDIVFIVPRIENMPESKIESMYAQLVKEFIDSNPNIGSSTNGVNVIFPYNQGAVQIDLVSVLGDRVEWARSLTPEHGIKGAVSTSLYSSMADALNLSFSSRGLQVKLKNNKPVSFRQSKDIVLKTISHDPKNWAIDILKFFAELQNKNEITVPKLLKMYSGTNIENVKLFDIANAIKSLSEAFGVNNMYGDIGLEAYKSSEEFLSKVLNTFSTKMNEKLHDPKFNKAVTPEALAKANSDRKKLKYGMDKVLSMF